MTRHLGIGPWKIAPGSVLKVHRIAASIDMLAVLLSRRGDAVMPIADDAEGPSRLIEELEKRPGGLHLANRLRDAAEAWGMSETPLVEGLLAGHVPDEAIRGHAKAHAEFERAYAEALAWCRNRPAGGRPSLS
jgi:hypothetical protein